MMFHIILFLCMNILAIQLEAYNSSLGLTAICTASVLNKIRAKMLLLILVSMNSLVVFNDCSGRTRSIFDTADKRFCVDSDGTVKLKRQVTLHNGHKGFSVHAWDSKGKKHTALVRVEHEDSGNRHKEQQEDVEASELVQVHVLF